MTAKVIVTVRTSEGRLLSLHLSEYPGRSLELLGIRDPHGDGWRASSVDLADGALRRAQGIDRRVLQAAHELFDHRRVA
jgi:hypothetical protein